MGVTKTERLVLSPSTQGWSLIKGFMSGSTAKAKLNFDYFFFLFLGEELTRKTAESAEVIRSQMYPSQKTLLILFLLFNGKCEI